MIRDKIHVVRAIMNTLHSAFPSWMIVREWYDMSYVYVEYVPL